MKKVKTFEARNNFSRLINLANQGQKIVVTRMGRPIAAIVPLDCIDGYDFTEIKSVDFSEWQLKKENNNDK